jgi:ABC-type lipoprotein export system ATPase subunit
MADEPTGNLDSINSRIVLELLQKLSTEGNTIITVTHDKDFARAAHRIIEMADGRILN